jgi:hypothetical protein
MQRTPQQRAHRAALADAADGRGHDQDPPDLLLNTPLRPCIPCPQCRTEVEQGMAHICTGRPEAAR